MTSISDNFWNRKIVTPTGCWEWQGSKDRKGYGRITRREVSLKPMLVHRLAWLLTHGDPGDQCVLHLCDNPPCFNPEHLFLGSINSNNQDMVLKGRYRQPPTHCPKNHPYEGENKYLNSNGYYECLECKRARGREYMQRKRDQRT